jgi:uncharacterized protein DUF3617
MRQDRRWVPAIALVIVVGAAAPSRAFEFEPGGWKEIETGTEDGKPVEPAVNSTCMTEEEAKNPVKGLSPEKGLGDLRGHCKTTNVKTSDTGLTMRLECGEPGQAQMTFSVDFVFNNARSYTGTVKSAMTMSGKSATASKKIEGRWMSSICTRKRAM